MPTRVPLLLQIACQQQKLPGRYMHSFRQGAHTPHTLLDHTSVWTPDPCCPFRRVWSPDLDHTSLIPWEEESGLRTRLQPCPSRTTSKVVVRFIETTNVTAVRKRCRDGALPLMLAFAFMLSSLPCLHTFFACHPYISLHFTFLFLMVGNVWPCV